VNQRLLFDHLPEIAQEISAARHLLLGLDFDGTLAPIVPHPEDAEIPPYTSTALEFLTSRPDVTVALISGRALADLKTRINLDAIFAGNHGLEISGRGFDFHHPEAAAAQSDLHQICDEIKTRLTGIRGTLVEDKGLTATVHTRNVADRDQYQVVAVVSAVVNTRRDKFDLREGKKTIEILPHTAWNKGAAMAWLRTRLEESRSKPGNSGELSVCYVGDDATDEDVFNIIDGITIRVGVDSSTAARFMVNDPEEVTAFLYWLLSVLPPAPHSA
jgi:trehalose 6-phosphate phosphatase